MLKWYFKTFIGKHMPTKIILLFFILLSTLLIVLTLLFTAKPLYLKKMERQRIANLQKVYHKSYFRKRNQRIPERSIALGQEKINMILDKNPILFDNASYRLEQNQSRTNFKTLKQIIEVLNHIKERFIVKIETHTRKKGSKRENLLLSQKRADQLKSFIKNRSNIIFISAIGYGEEIQNGRKKKSPREKYVEIELKRIR
jgi:outer membrane protein OmpA-like peptidoglycan-associated protein